MMINAFPSDGSGSEWASMNDGAHFVGQATGYISPDLHGQIDHINEQKAAVAEMLNIMAVPASADESLQSLYEKVLTTSVPLQNTPLEHVELGHVQAVASVDTKPGLVLARRNASWTDDIAYSDALPFQGVGKISCSDDGKIICMCNTSNGTTNVALNQIYLHYRKGVFFKSYQLVDATVLYPTACCVSPDGKKFFVMGSPNATATNTTRTLRVYDISFDENDDLVLTFSWQRTMTPAGALSANGNFAPLVVLGYSSDNLLMNYVYVASGSNPYPYYYFYDKTAAMVMNNGTLGQSQGVMYYANRNVPIVVGRYPENHNSGFVIYPLNPYYYSTSGYVYRIVSADRWQFAISLEANKPQRLTVGQSYLVTADGMEMQASVLQERNSEQNVVYVLEVQGDALIWTAGFVTKKRVSILV